MNNSTHEKLDKIMSLLAAEASLDESTVADIASSPQLWWAVQRGIAAGKESHAPWPPPKAWWHSLGFLGIAAIAGFLIIVGVVSFSVIVETPPLVGGQRVNQPTLPVQVESGVDEPVQLVAEPAEPKGARIKPPSANRTKDRPIKERILTSTKPTVREEIKSDFIALTYSGNPESGQVVRVKVPSSMMVSLGLIESVAKPATLVDAEVVVGDDGQTHAIRFIRQSAR